MIANESTLQKRPNDRDSECRSTYYEADDILRLSVIENENSTLKHLRPIRFFLFNFTEC